MTVTNVQRMAEWAKYTAAYKLPIYRMGSARMRDAESDLRGVPCRGSFLDVGCGRGEMLSFAESVGFSPVVGAEVVDDLIDGKRVLYSEAHQLRWPDDSFDVVSMNDVLEHLPRGDDELACRELRRVSKGYVLLTANNRPSKLPSGEDLHINIRDYVEWDRCLREWFDGCQVQWLRDRQYVSEGWRITLP